VQLPLGQIDDASHAPDVVLVRVAEMVPENEPAFAVVQCRMTCPAKVYQLALENLALNDRFVL
jgi:hypothetical protein